MTGMKIVKRISLACLAAFMILGSYSCSRTTADIAEDDAKEVASVYAKRFLTLLEKADSVNARILQRISYREQNAQSSVSDVGELISGKEAEAIWGDLVNDQGVLQAVVHIGRTNGIGVNLLLHPELDYVTEGLGFKAEFRDVNLAGTYGRATEVNDKGTSYSMVKIENAKTRSKDGGYLQVVMILNADYIQTSM